jgi:polyisoprenoid-binding protein YceI
MQEPNFLRADPGGLMTTPAPATSAALRAQLASGSLAGHWTLDPARSAATLRSKSVWGLVAVKGVFRELEGDGEVSADGSVTGRIALATASLDTGNRKRDTHLRSADFFLSEEYPVIVVAVDSLVTAGEGVTVSGRLTVRDQSQPVSFPAAAALTGDGDITLDAGLQVDRSQFGLTWNQLGMSSTKNDVTIHAVFTRS